MAGFGVFRNYQKASMVALAILAMLAFFVLPPLLQFTGQSATLADTPVATWKGGELRESTLDRAVTMKRVLNRFLAESMQRAGRDPAQAPQFATDEESVVQTILLANEARKNGIVVSDAAINDFLGKVTSGLVRPEQFEEIISGLRTGAAGVSQHHLFETIREQLLAQNLLNMLQHGFFGDPPGLRWDYFRRMEQSATVEVVPVDVRSVTDQVKTPQTAELRRFFEKYKEDLPNPRSDEPGFREPHRAKVEYVIARQGVFQEAISKEITDTEIAEFYEAKKATMFRAKPATTPAPTSPAPEAPADTPPAEQPAAAEAVPADPTSDATPADAPAAPTEPAAADPANPPAEPATPPETPAEPGSPEKPADGSGAAVTGSPFRRVAYQAPDEEPQADAPAAEPKPDVPASAEPAVTEAAVGEPAAAVPDAGAAAPEAVQFEPLEAVTERIRGQIARERATAKIDILFDRISSDIEGYNQDYALWKAREEARGIAPPNRPDVQKIANLNGLEAGPSELLSADQAYEAGGIGRSFEFVPDPGSRFGVRQQQWVEMVYGQGAVGLRGIRSRDMEGNRYLSWRTEDQPEFVPTFETARPTVELAWKIVEGRALARKRAEEIAAKAAGAESLEAAIAGDDTLQAFKAGPFFWMSPQAAASGFAQRSQPAGLVIPGDEFMSTVFGLQPGAIGVAFNEPKTVCYCVRLIDVEPPADQLRERFVQSRADPRLTGIVAQEEQNKSLRGWYEGLESRYKLDWKRKPRR